MNYEAVERLVKSRCLEVITLIGELELYVGRELILHHSSRIFHQVIRLLA